MAVRLQRLTPFAAPVLSSILILLAAPAQYLGRQQDDLLYILASLALSHGRYHLPTSPAYIPLVMVNPGLPTLLLPVAWLFGMRLWAYQIAAALMAAALPWAYAAWLSRRAEEPTRSLLILLFSSSPLVLSQSGCVMSEIPYLLLLLPWLLLLEKAPGERPARRGAWLWALCELRLAALSLFPAAVAAAPMGRRRRQAAIVAGIAGGGLLPWFWWSHEHGGVQKVSEFFLAAGSARRVIPAAYANALYYLQAWAQTYGPAAWHAHPWLARGAGTLLALVAARGAARLWRENSAERPALWALGGSTILYLLWPWHYHRYLMTLLPWLLWCLARGAGARRAALLSLLLACQFSWGSLAWISGRSPDAKPGLQETYSWIREHTQPWEALSSPLYVRDGLYARRPCLPLPDAGSAASFSSRLKRIQARIILRETRLDLGFSDPKSSLILQRLSRDYVWLDDPAYFRRIYDNPRENAAIYEPL
jgi:hypothetical protein